MRYLNPVKVEHWVFPNMNYFKTRCEFPLKAELMIFITKKKMKLNQYFKIENSR